MNETPKTFHVETPEYVPSTSLYGEMIRSRDYTGMSHERLTLIGNYWSQELKSEERSPRAKVEIDKLLTRVAFEIMSQEKQIDILNKLYEEA